MGRKSGNGATNKKWTLEFLDGLQAMVEQVSTLSMRKDDKSANSNSNPITIDLNTTFF